MHSYRSLYKSLHNTFGFKKYASFTGASKVTRENSYKHSLICLSYTMTVFCKSIYFIFQNLSSKRYFSQFSFSDILRINFIIFLDKKKVKKELYNFVFIFYHSIINIYKRIKIYQISIFYIHREIPPIHFYIV